MTANTFFPEIQENLNTKKVFKVASWIVETRKYYPLWLKVKMTQNRIMSWYNYYNGRVYVSFSGGKDSTVLLDIVRDLFPEVPAVFVDTGLEYPEIVDFVKTVENVIWLKPKMPFRDVIRKYGYPVVSKEQSMAISRYRKSKNELSKFRRLHGFPRGKKGTISKKWQYLIKAPFEISDVCCDVMKKKPLDDYVKKSGRFPMSGMMAYESQRRMLNYQQNGCNMFDLKRPISWPLSFWVDVDVWEYIKNNGISYSSIYDMGEKRTGCMFCMFGVHLEKGENRFQRMYRTHPKQYKYCMDKLGLKRVLEYLRIPYKPSLIKGFFN